MFGAQWTRAFRKLRCRRSLRRTLLEWYGAEFVCPEGHGLLHEPKLVETSYCASRWARLDASWRELFH